MDYAAYQNAYFVKPAPTTRFAFTGIHGATLFFEEYASAVAFYSAVLGPPTYVEGDNTRGWPVGNTWLTLLKGAAGTPKNIEIPIVMQTPAEAERLHSAFLAAGATGGSPSDQLMYRPVRSCPVTDPFGTDIMIYSLLPVDHD